MNVNKVLQEQGKFELSINRYYEGETVSDKFQNNRLVYCLSCVLTNATFTKPGVKVNLLTGAETEKECMYIRTRLLESFEYCISIINMRDLEHEYKQWK